MNEAVVRPGSREDGAELTAHQPGTQNADATIISHR
jgi:hypothetical protein